MPSSSSACYVITCMCICLHYILQVRPFVSLHACLPVCLPAMNWEERQGSLKEDELQSLCHIGDDVFL